MARLREWIARVWGTLRPGRQDGDLEQELRLHQELAGERGGVAQAVEAMRDQRGLPWLDDFLRDTRHAWRLLLRNPAFTAVAVVSIALGIGANSAMFSLADELLLRPLPVRDPGSIVTISADTPDEGFQGGGVSYPNYRDLRDSTHAFDGLLAYQISSVSFGRSRDAARAMYLDMTVSGNFFDVLGVPPAIGRTFTPDEDRVPGRDAVVVLGYDFWQTALGSDPSIVNSIVWINGIDFRVAGVAPATFTGVEPPVRPALYVPVMMAQRLGAAAENPLEKRDTRAFGILGRLAHGTSKERARAELATLWSALAVQYPDANRNRTIAVRTEIEQRLDQDPWDTILMAILLALAAVVMVIACANVANLMLGRGRARSREMAIRLALGVGRARLLRQLLTEALLLSVLGLALGLAIAYGGIRFLQTIPTADQIVIAPQLDHRVLIFGVLVAAASALLFGLAPARQSLHTDLVPGLKTAEAGDTTRRRLFGRNALVVAQIALSMVLTLATGMLADGFRKVLALDPGFRTDHVMMMTSDTELVRYTPAQTRAFYRDLVERARALPGVTAVGLTNSVPFKVGEQNTRGVIPEGYQLPTSQEYVSSASAVVNEGYFSAMGVALVRGRGFTSADAAGTRGVAVVNEEFVKKYWPGADPIGKRVRLIDGDKPWLEVVGVTKTGKYMWIAETPKPFIYLPFAQQDRMRMSLIVETISPDAAYLAAPLRDIVRTLDVNLPVLNAQTYAQLFHERAVAMPLMIMQVVATMGLLGLALGLIGLYALVAYSVARRTREIGIRMAIGAGKGDVLRMVMRQGLTLSIAGIAIGGVAGIVVARLLAAALAGVGSPSPATYVIVPAALMCLTMAASYVPARRASLVDPLEAVRYE
jgi:putative ABC transport system permease protein